MSEQQISPDAREAAPFSAGRWTHEPTGECFDASVLNGLVQHYIAAALPRDADALTDRQMDALWALALAAATYVADAHLPETYGRTWVELQAALYALAPNTANPSHAVVEMAEAALRRAASQASSVAPSASAARQTDATPSVATALALARRDIHDAGCHGRDCACDICSRGFPCCNAGRIVDEVRVMIYPHLNRASDAHAG